MDWVGKIRYKVAVEERTRIYLLRHGRVEGVEAFPVYGHMDVGLSDIGRIQLQRMAERLRYAEIDAIFSSDLERSLNSAKIIASHHDKPVFPLKELRELYLGEWEGLSLTQIRREYPRELEERKNDIINFRPPGNGETIKELAERVYGCIDGLLDTYKGKSILIVAHGAVNRVILVRFLGMDLKEVFRLQQDYGCLNIIDLYGDFPVIRLLNGG